MTYNKMMNGIKDELAYRLRVKTDCEHCGVEKLFEPDGEYKTSQGVLCKLHWLKLLVKNAEGNTRLEDEFGARVKNYLNPLPEPTRNQLKTRCALCVEYRQKMEQPNDKGEYITSRGILCKYHWNKEFTGRCVAND